MRSDKTRNMRLEVGEAEKVDLLENKEVGQGLALRSRARAGSLRDS